MLLQVAKTHTKGLNKTSKKFIGLAQNSANFSGYCIDIHFGNCSPRSTCKKVTKANEIGTAIVCDVIETFMVGNKTIIFSIILTTVASPTQPKAILAIVIPNWIAASISFILSTVSRAIFAVELPSLANCSNLVFLTFTRANSEATKKAFAKINIATTKIFNKILWSIYLLKSLYYLY